MKSMIFILALTASAYASENYVQSEEHTKEISRRRCECSVTDANYRHFYGSSNQSAQDAQNRAMNQCWTFSDAPGTCTIASYDPCGCSY